MWTVTLWTVTLHRPSGNKGKHSTLAGSPRQGQSLAFTYGTINFIMRPKNSSRKIESKQPDIKLPPNIDISKLGIESKQVIIFIITYFIEMFEKKDREIKELQANVSCWTSVLSSWNNKLTKTQLVNRRIHWWWQALYLLRNMHRTASPLCETNPRAPAPRVSYWRYLNGPLNWCQTQNPRRG